MKASRVSVGAALAIAASFALGESQPAKSVKWKITGQLEEACSCNPACPCWFDSKPSKMTCGGSQILFIQKGNYGKVKLDGLAVANYAESPEGRTMVESFGKWIFSTNYIDEKADAAQRAALEAIALAVLPARNASANFQTKYVPITRKIEGKEHRITIGGVATVKGRLVEGGLGGSSIISNPPGADPLHRQYLQGRTTAMTYSDSGQSWDWKDSNYMQGTFTIDSDQYAKYAAGLSQKMAAPK